MKKNLYVRKVTVVIILVLISVLFIQAKKQPEQIVIPEKYQSLLQFTNEEILHKILNNTEISDMDFALSVMVYRTKLYSDHSCDYGSGLICMRPSTVKMYQKELGFLENGNLNKERLNENIMISMMHIEREIQNSSTLEEAIYFICGNVKGNEVEDILKIYNELRGDY